MDARVKLQKRRNRRKKNLIIMKRKEGLAPRNLKVVPLRGQERLLTMTKYRHATAVIENDTTKQKS